MDRERSGTLKMDSRIQNYPNAKFVEVDFGESEVGVTKTKSIKIVNQCNVRQVYSVQKDVMSNPLDCVFHINEYNWALDPFEFYVCDIVYRPILPNRKYVDYFYITDAYECCYEILVRSTSLGPNVTISTTRLVLACENGQCLAEGCFELKNNSNFPAEFTFDVDVEQCPFKVSEVSGVIKASACKCFNVIFKSADIGIHKYNLACLVLNQNPIIMELYGLCGCWLDKTYLESIYSKIDDIEMLDPSNSFLSYMSDVTTALRSDPPAISLTTCCVDFGHAEVGLENTSKRAPHTTSLTNHSNFAIFVKWDTDVEGVFSIQPRKAKIRGYQSAIFEIRFDPSEDNKIYYRQLMLRIFRMPCCLTIFDSCDELQRTVIPEILSVRLIGHTLSSSSCLPQHEVPEAVTMPACSPTSATYATFAIRSFGKQPLMYSLAPPAGSRYSLKPSLGLIARGQERQVIVAQLFAESPAEHEYVERWSCRLNGGLESDLCVDLRGLAERPYLYFGRDNSLVFQPVHIGYHERMGVPVRNSTRHPVKFEFCPEDIPKELKIETMSGIIDPNDTVFHDWIFMPDQLKSYSLSVTCRISTERDSKTSDIVIEIFGSGMEGSLIAISEDLNFGLQEYKKSGELAFTIFNFSTVTIPYVLVCRAVKSLETTSEQEKDITMSPNRGSIAPGKSEKCVVTVVPSQPGYHEMDIDYFTEITPLPLEPKHLCRAYYACYLPLLQVMDILYQVETNKNINKISLWKSLNIENLNVTMKALMPNEKASVDMTVPFNVLYEGEKFIIKLLLVNVHPVKANYYFRKKRTCLCSDEKLKKRYGKRKMRNECAACVFDRSCTISPETIKLSPKEKCILSIEVTDHPIIPSGILWELNLGHERQILLNLKLGRSFVTSGHLLKFNNIFIKHCINTYCQAVWLYNDSEKQSTYTVDVQNLISCNRKSYGIIFTCLDKQGTIEPFGRKAILFSFCPNRIGYFQTTIPIKMNNDKVLLDIEAESTFAPTPIFTSYEKCPSSDTFTSPDVTVYFNNDYMMMPPLKTYAKATRIVMMHNHDPLDVLEYRWNNYEVPGVVMIEIKPARGLIQPQSLLTFLVVVTVGKYTGSIDVDVFCDFINASQRRIEAKKKAKQNNVVERMKGEFTITEKGISYPKPPVFEPIKKPATFCKTLTLRIEVYNPRDADEKVKLDRQLKGAAGGDLLPEMVPQPNSYTAKNIDMFSQIIQGVLWDIVNSKNFEHTLKNDLLTEHHLKYSQLPVNIIDRCVENTRIKHTPPKEYVNDILYNMICMIFHEEFNLNTEHFTLPSDIRQISYQKVYSAVYTQRTGRKSST